MLKRQSERAGRLAAFDRDIAGLEAEANVEKALHYFDQAVQNGCVQDLHVDVFNQLLRVLSHYANTSDALRVLRHMDDGKIPRTSATFAALINLFGRAGDIDAARRYFAESQSNDPCCCCCHVYNAFVDAQLKSGLVDEALQTIRQDMPANGIKVTAIPYNAVVRYYCARGVTDEAKALVATMPVTPDASTFGPILSAHCQANEFEEATQVYQELLKTDISKSYGNLANYAVLCLKHARSDKALEVIAVDMHAAGLEPDSVLVEQVVASMLSHEDKALDVVVEALQRMVRAMSSRSLAKASTRLLAVANDLIERSDKHFTFVLSVVAAILPAVSRTSLPHHLATVLLASYDTTDKAHASLSAVEHCEIMLEAALAAPDAKHFGELACKLLESIKAMQKTLVLPQDLVQRVLRRLQHTGEAEAAALWQETFCASSCVPESQADAASKEVMKAVMRHEVQEAVRILKQDIIGAGLVPCAESMRDAIALAGKQGHLEEALELYEASMQVFESRRLREDDERGVYMVTNSILIGFAQQGDMAQAKVYYDRIKRMGRYPDSNAYASLLIGVAQSACTTDEAADALTIYEEAKRHRVKPTTFFYNVVISKLAKARKLEAALRLFEEMQTLFKLTPNTITYGAVISACARAGSEQHACRLFQEMLQSNQPLRIGPFNNMIQFYVRQQPDRERALFYYAELRRHHLSPSSHTYKLLMEAYCMIAPYNMDKAHQLLSDMERKDNLKPQPTHYATLIYAYGTTLKDVPNAKRVFDKVRSQRGSWPATEQEVVYQAMLDTLITNGYMEQAEAVYEQMLQDIKKSTSPYIENLLLRGYGSKGWIAKAESLFERMSDDKSAKSGVVVREPSTYEAMVRAYLENGMVGKAKSVLDRMVRRQFPQKVVASVAALILE